VRWRIKHALSHESLDSWRKVIFLVVLRERARIGR
jgi:hypothetical protein